MKLLFSLTLIFVSFQGITQMKNPFDVSTRVLETTEERKAGEKIILSNDTLPTDSNGYDQGELIPFIQPKNPFDIDNSVIQPTQGVQKATSSLLESIHTTTPGKDNTILVLIYGLVMLIIMTLAISMDKDRFNEMIKSCINSNYLRSLYRDNKAWTNGQGIIFYAMFVLNGAFIIWQLSYKSINGWQLSLFFILGAIVLCYVVRHLLLWMISWIFPIGNEVSLHNFSIGIHNMVLGIFLLPLIMAIEFLPGISYKIFLYGVLAVFMLIYLLRQVKGLLSCVGMRGFNPFYFFIYLCAIEIAPVLVAYRMIIGAL